TYMGMALKAQSQCQTTLEALAEIKHPKSATFVKQQNIAQQQHVNNGTYAGTPPPPGPRAHEKDITPTNELLEASNGQRLDSGAPQAAGRTDSGMETVGA